MRDIADKMHVDAGRIHVGKALFQIPRLARKRILDDVGDFSTAESVSIGCNCNPSDGASFCIEAIIASVKTWV